MMKIPMETKAMKWEDYYEQNSRSALGLSKAVAEAVDDSVVEAVDTQVMKQHMLLNNAITDGCVAPLTMLLTIVIMYHKFLSF